MRRVALFGGTFDPVHRGHLFMAERAQARCALEEVVFVPCRRSPHKPGGTPASAEDRVAMLRLATRELPWARVSRWELDGEETSFSWKTAEHWRAEVVADGVALYWILGLDQWLNLSRWARADYLASLVTFIVFPRGGDVPRAQPGRKALFLPDTMAISATEIRTRCAAGESIEEEVGKEVGEYIRKNNLYRSA